MTNKKLYESIMRNIAPIVKKAILEADANDIKLITDFDGNESISVYDEYAITKFMKGKTVSAYDPTVKAGKTEKEWTMYAVRITDITDCSCAYLGYNKGWPDYWTSGMTLYGKISIIKGGQGQNIEPGMKNFAGKLVIENDPKNKRLTFTPYAFDGKIEDMRPDSDKFSHFAHRLVSVPYSAIAKEVSATDDRTKNLIKDLSTGYQSRQALKRLIKQGYFKIEDGKLVPTKDKK